MDNSNVGAPNSIARYVANNSWGDNEYCVMKYETGKNGIEPVCIAAGSHEHCKRYETGETFICKTPATHE